jgi:hypothetical protein
MPSVGFLSARRAAVHPAPGLRESGASYRFTPGHPAADGTHRINRRVPCHQWLSADTPEEWKQSLERLVGMEPATR